MTQTVLLTGANGFIAIHILRALLAKGYDVIGTVRSESKTPYLKTLFAEHLSKLKFVVVEDIASPGAFDSVLKENRIDSVLHTSSPFFLTANDVEKELYEPAINGTTGILKSIKAHAPLVKRVVVLSSFASVINPSSGDRPGYTYRDDDWNPITYEAGKENGNVGYYASKKLAELAAWEFMEKEQPNFSLTTLCPPMVYGPPDQEVTSLDNLNTSCKAVYEAFTGKSKYSVGVWIWVDVRDLADAHVAAIESPAAAGQRYVISEGNFSPQHFIDFIWKRYPERAKEASVDKGTPGQFYPETGVYKVDSSKSRRDLGLSYNSFDKMCGDMFARFEELEAESK